MQDVLQRIYDYSLEEIMGERFGAYSKYIIQDRAIPDVRDGLKPVQRRVLYAMYKDKNVFSKQYRKSAKTVGNVMANYHPHGDSSIYEAMVRLSQEWKIREPLVDMHGNKGSVDGDSPAAMRYTEARLAKISDELLKGLERDTVLFTPNFDDTEMEPTVLPAKFPNLLVNGATGISAGYATNIPPHNLTEVIKAVIKRIDKPECTLSEVLRIIKGPDFPTGGTAQGVEGLKQAYKTGRGKIVVRSKVESRKTKGKTQLVITEIPYEVNKANLVAKMDEIRIDKKISGISEVRDESDRDGLTIVVDLKKDANEELVLNYFLKNTDLQIAYNFNVIAIVNRRPKQLGLLDIIDAYINHQIDVITRRTKFDLAHAEKRMHIVEGLIKALSILDEVIKTIRGSKNKSDAKANLVKEYAFTEEQAEAIVTLQLYKLTNTDVTMLEDEADTLKNIIKRLTEILNNKEVLMEVIKHELTEIKEEYGTPRRTIIEEEIEEIKIDTNLMIPEEDVVVTVSKDGYIKRVSNRSFLASDGDTELKEGDYLVGEYKISTKNTLLVFTDQGNYLHIPVHILPDLKWKDLGTHISNVIKISSNENIIASVPIYNFEDNKYITIFTKNGMVKRVMYKDLQVTRYSKPMTAIKLKTDDLVTDVINSTDKEVFISTNNGYGLWYDIEEIPLSGPKASGVKSINLKEDFVASGSLFNIEKIDYLSVFTDKGAVKRIKISEFSKTSRAKRGVQIIREVKSNPHKVIKTVLNETKSNVNIKTPKEILEVKLSQLPISDRYSLGSILSKDGIETIYNKATLKEETVEEKTEEPQKELNLQEIDDKILTIDDFIKDI
jgi:topoisomerase-4 subunit A